MTNHVHLLLTPRKAEAVPNLLISFGQRDTLLSPHPLYRALGSDDTERQAACRELFRAQLDRAAVDDIRLAVHQGQRVGNARLHAKIEQMTGIRREGKPRGRPRIRAEMAERG